MLFSMLDSYKECYGVFICLMCTLFHGLSLLCVLFHSMPWLPPVRSDLVTIWWCIGFYLCMCGLYSLTYHITLYHTLLYIFITLICVHIYLYILIHLKLKSSFPKRVECNSTKWACKPSAKFKDCVFGKEFFTCVYMYIFMKNSFSKHNLRAWLWHCNIDFGIGAWCALEKSSSSVQVNAK